MIKKLLSLLGSKDSSVADEWVPKQASISSEELCGIDPNSMSDDAIRKKLAKLYKRYNSAVSSLNPELRKEGKLMLEAIVDCRERYVDLRTQ